ncbi:hypothetical protein [uncultured Jatrophihabitans sp.]|uniref:hypothetical protein n=1 Tax=uncultured Jatrophihabitans sp. TaxID=1610747 RepID=UPI0035CAA7AC
MRDQQRRNVGNRRFDAVDQREGIDFVESDDEDLPTSQGSRLRVEGWRPRAEEFLRGRYGLPLVVVLAVLALLVGRALMHERPAGAPPVTPAPSNTRVTLDRSTGRVIDLPRRTGPDPTRCPGLQCYTSPSVPASVRAAVRAVFPTARFTATETTRLVDQALGDPLWYREVIARAGTATLTLRVQAHAAGDTPDGDAKDDGSHSVTSIDAVLQQWFVRAQVIDRSGTGDVFDELSRLAADQRLVAT